MATTIKSQIHQLQKQRTLEIIQHQEKLEKIQEKLDVLWEKNFQINVGDRVKVTSILVRERHRNQDIAILGKKGTVVRIHNGSIRVLIDGERYYYPFLLIAENLEKIKPRSYEEKI